MEEQCFSSLRKKRGAESNAYCQKLSDGLTFPVYIITSTFNSPYLSHLQKLLDQESITLSYQNQTDRLKKIPGAHERRFFIILNDFRQAPNFSGQFLKLSCEIAEYPKQSLETILHFYNLFVQKEKSSSNQTSVLNQPIFLTNMCEKKQIISSTDTERSAKIQMRSISKIVHNYKSSFPKKLFVYSNPNDEEFFLECLRVIDKYQIQNAEFITRIEQYLRFLPNKDDVRYFVVMSEYSAVNLRKFFKKCDDLIVCTKTPENCMPLLKGKVTQIICDLKILNNLILKHFSNKLKGRNQPNSALLKPGSGVVFPTYAQNSNLQFFHAAQIPHSSVLPSSMRSSENLKISQQFSMITTTKKQLNIQSSVIGVKLTPQNSSLQSGSLFKVKQNFTVISPSKISHEEQFHNPLKIVQLEHIDLAACSQMELMSSASGSNIFAQVQNTLDQVQQSQDKITPNSSKLNKSYASVQSELYSQTSRTSQRSSKNSRIIERYKCHKKQNNLI